MNVVRQWTARKSTCYVQSLERVQSLAPNLCCLSGSGPGALLWLTLKFRSRWQRLSLRSRDCEQSKRLQLLKLNFSFWIFFFWTVTSREGEPKSLYEKKWIHVNIWATALPFFPLPNINPNLLSVDCCWFRGGVSCSDTVIDPKKLSRLTRLPYRALPSRLAS